MSIIILEIYLTYDIASNRRLSNTTLNAMKIIFTKISGKMCQTVEIMVVKGYTTYESFK
ncbi:hypothetical protein H9L01_09225 [Erysipelothrix inopinata]|uniref:Uncharacterized protein n=1 Tax=Erysipelothrix inopinata TaxID=225084 RepID=A0A7G9RY64_9FIRM|nr:hypothetical protein [Erysipelothrix inopinata]QNN60539.1 hypothetical protein H9L01_09225 [Erysipelothrix inopinata]